MVDKVVNPLLLCKVWETYSLVFSLGGAKVAGGANFGAFVAHFVVYCAEVVRSIPSCFGVKMYTGGLYQHAKFGWGRLTLARDIGVQTGENRHFTFLKHGFVVYCAEVICTIPSCFGVKM